MIEGDADLGQEWCSESRVVGGVGATTLVLEHLLWVQILGEHAAQIEEGVREGGREGNRSVGELQPTQAAAR